MVRLFQDVHDALRGLRRSPALGLMLALATSRVVSTMLFGVTRANVATCAGVLLLAMPLVMTAAAIPAPRAASVDLLLALTSE